MRDSTSINKDMNMVIFVSVPWKFLFSRLVFTESWQSDVVGAICYFKLNRVKHHFYPMT